MEAEREQRLIESAKQGDLSAFDELAARHERPLYAFALRFSGDPEFAEDAVQEVLVRAWSSLGRFTSGKDFQRWLLGIAAHVCTDWLRRQERRRQAETVGPLTLVSPDAADPDPDTDPQQAYQRRELREAVAAAVRQLPSSYRTVIVLRFQHEMKIREIAEVLNLSPKAVEIRIRRAKARLRPLLEPLYPELAASTGPETEIEGRCP